MRRGSHCRSRSRHCYVNRYARFVGRPAEEILGHTVADLVGAGPYAALLPLGDRALAGEAVRWEGWMPHHESGEPRFVQRFYVPYRTPSGSIDGYFLMNRHLTSLEQAAAPDRQLAALRQALSLQITTAAR
jgi:two-component system NtrC family sensor kinase